MKSAPPYTANRKDLLQAASPIRVIPIAGETNVVKNITTNA